MKWKISEVLLSPTQESHPLLKNAGEKPACGFFCSFIIVSITQKEKLTEKKTGTPVFPTAVFQTACDSCVGDQPEQSTTAQEKCDSR